MSRYARVAAAARQLAWSRWHAPCCCCPVRPIAQAGPTSPSLPPHRPPTPRGLPVPCGLQYTLGFPASSAPGQPDWFKLARRLLPGPFTFILLASKEMPKQV